jgi:hypothetical protein
MKQHGNLMTHFLCAVSCCASNHFLQAVVF